MSRFKLLRQQSLYVKNALKTTAVSENEEMIVAVNTIYATA